jgi:hypothetical protein
MQKITRQYTTPTATINSYEHGFQNQDQAKKIFNKILSCNKSNYKITADILHDYFQLKQNYVTQSQNGQINLNKTNYQYNSKPIYFSLDLVNIIQKIDDKLDNQLTAGIDRVYNDLQYIDPIKRLFIKELSSDLTDLDNTKIKLKDGKVICELRPHLFKDFSVDIIGDIRLIGWMDDQGYYFTEIATHNDINTNLVKVALSLIEGQKYNLPSPQEYQKKVDKIAIMESDQTKQAISEYNDLKKIGAKNNDRRFWSAIREINQGLVAITPDREKNERFHLFKLLLNEKVVDYMVKFLVSRYSTSQDIIYHGTASDALPGAELVDEMKAWGNYTKTQQHIKKLVIL